MNNKRYKYKHFFYSKSDVFAHPICEYCKSYLHFHSIDGYIHSFKILEYIEEIHKYPYIDFRFLIREDGLYHKECLRSLKLNQLLNENI